MTTMTEKMKKVKVPRILTMAKFKSSIELGVWFAGVAISNAIIMMVFNWLIGKVQDRINKARFERMLAAAQQQEKTPVANAEGEIVADMMVAEAA